MNDNPEVAQFVDTNILIYAFDHSAGHKHEIALQMMEKKIHLSFFTCFGAAWERPWKSPQDFLAGSTSKSPAGAARSECPPV